MRNYALITTLALQPTIAMTATPQLDYPETERIEHVDVYHGVEVADPYRWLEEDVRESSRVADWVAIQQAVTNDYLQSLPERKAFEQRLTDLWNFERRSSLRRIGEGDNVRYLYKRNDGLQNQSVLYITDDPHFDGEVLIDPNSWSDDGTAALTDYEASYDGRYLAYLRSEAGSDWRKIYVLDLETSELLKDRLAWVKFSGVSWMPDGSGFYYNRYPEPEEGHEFQGAALNSLTCFHRLGTDQSEDEVVYRNEEHPDWRGYSWPTDDGRYLLLYVSAGTDNKNQLYYRPLNADSKEWRALIEDFDNEFLPIGSEEDRLYLVTDYEAPRRRIVAMKLDTPGRDSLIEVVTQSDATLESANYFGSKIIAQYLEDVAAAVRVYSPAGERLGEISFPGFGSANGFRGRQDTPEVFFTYTSYDAPPTTFRYEIASGKTEPLFQPKVDLDLTQFTVRRDFYESKDGTRIPIFLLHRKGMKLDGNNPTLLYGYGGFTISLTPYYSPSRLAWVERGGVFALANLRGGGEYGEAWHEAGKVLNKQNVFDDFIAAAEWLTEEKVTSPEHLAIQGGSNGGLLVGAVMTQRPDLFAAVTPSVAVMDMLRFHNFTAGQFWRDEYGSSDDPEHFEFLRTYSPYHNIKPGVEYPATLITTADTDDRVVPMHSFKFAAALQHAHKGDAPVMIRIETRAGHGASTPTRKRIEEAADVWAFLWEQVATD